MIRNKKSLEPPKHLEKATRAWWSEVIRVYELESHHLRLLEAACEAWDRTVQARKELEKHGSITYKNRFGEPRPHPAVAIERDSKTLFARLLRELDLDVEPPLEAKRPPALHSIRGGANAG